MKAAAHGSQLYPRAAGHMQFAELPAWEQGPANLGCHSNPSVTSIEVIQDVADLMIAWFDHQLKLALTKGGPGPQEEGSLNISSIDPFTYSSIVHAEADAYAF